MGSQSEKWYDPSPSDESIEDPLRSEYSWFMVVATAIILLQVPGVFS